MKNELLKEELGERLDDLQCNNLFLIQNPSKFCFGIDAVLLANFVKAKNGGHIIDLCTGSGIVPVLLSAKTSAKRITGIEIQKDIADMANRSVLYNSLEEKIDKKLLKVISKNRKGGLFAYCFNFEIDVTFNWKVYSKERVSLPYGYCKDTIYTDLNNRGNDTPDNVIIFQDAFDESGLWICNGDNLK